MNMDWKDTLEEYSKKIEELNDAKWELIRENAVCKHCGAKLNLPNKEELSVSAYTITEGSAVENAINSFDSKYCNECWKIEIPKERESREYKGFITYNDEDGLELDGVGLVEKVMDDFGWVTKIDGSIRRTGVIKDANVSIFISENELSEEQMLEKILTGDVSGHHSKAGGYSEYTQWDMSEDLKIGGHDLYKILKSFIGMYCVLKVTG